MSSRSSSGRGWVWVGLRGFGRLNFDSGWGKGPNHTRGIEPATFSRAPEETAARPMKLSGHSSVGKWLCHKPFWGGSRAQSPCPTRNRDFGVAKGSGSIGYWGTSGSGRHPALVQHPALKAAVWDTSHGTRRLNKSLYKGSMWLL